MENNEVVEVLPTNLNKGVVAAGAVLGGVLLFVAIPKVVKIVKAKLESRKQCKDEVELPEGD